MRIYIAENQKLYLLKRECKEKECIYIARNQKFYLMEPESEKQVPTKPRFTIKVTTKKSTKNT